MNDDHALTAVKERLAKVRDSLGEAYPGIPADEIVARARSRRVRRRLIPGLTAVLALAAGAAVALSTLFPASHPASRQPGVQLTAWTVNRQPGGIVKVTIRELHDPAGLQARLRADGVPATVAFVGQLNPACRPWPGAPLYGRNTPAGAILIKRVFPPMPQGARPGVLVIRPSALPAGGGVQLEAGFGHPGGGAGAGVEIGVGLVRTSPGCTGS